MAIAMLNDVPHYVPGGPDKFHRTDIASFRELYDSVHVLYAQCRVSGRRGWIAAGKIWSIIPIMTYEFTNYPWTLT